MLLIEPFLFIGWSLLPHYDMDIDTLVNSKEAKLYLLLLIIVGITLLMVAADIKNLLDLM